MMNCTDQIFSVARVHSSFSTNRAVHHCEQSGGNLHMRDAAVINRSDESRNIPDDSAAKTNHKRLPVKPSSDHLIANCASLLERLGFLAWRNRDQRWPETRRC